MNKTHNCNNVMRTCKYCTVISGNLPVCDYLSMTGSRRGCPPEQCDKYEKKEKKRKFGI